MRNYELFALRRISLDPNVRSSWIIESTVGTSRYFMDKYPAPEEAIQADRKKFESAPKKYLKAYAQRLWGELEDVPFDEDEDGRIILFEDWHGHPKGMEREEIWLWFEKEFGVSVAADLMGLINPVKYAIVAYDKDNDVYDTLDYGQSVDVLIPKLREYKKLIRNDELRRERDGEPYDWAFIEEIETQRRIVATYELEEGQ